MPGCGPQVLVTTMYLAGIVPLSAQIGNAISNDGDALFPAIAIAPKVAVVATIYSAVPAIIISTAGCFCLNRRIGDKTSKVVIFQALFISRTFKTPWSHV